MRQSTLVVYTANAYLAGPSIVPPKLVDGPLPLVVLIGF